MFDILINSAAEIGYGTWIAAGSYLAGLLALLAAFLFTGSMRTEIGPEYGLPVSMVRSALACGIAVHVLLFFALLSSIPSLPGANEMAYSALMDVQRNIFVSLGQLRYAEWIVTAPLILIAIPLFAGVRGGEARKIGWTLVFFSTWFILFGLAGEFQQTAAGTPDTPGRIIFGLIGLLGYAGIIGTMFLRVRGTIIISEPVERRAGNIMVMLLVTTWLIYPMVYSIPAFLPQIHYAYLHTALNILDPVNKIVPAVVMVVAGRNMTLKKAGRTSF